MRTSIIGVIVVAATGALVLTASATTYRIDDAAAVQAAGTPASGPAMVDQTLSGRVRETTAAWHGRKILTRVTVDLDGASADDPPSVFLVAGGSIDGLTMRVTGAPKFTPGERIRVSVRPTESGLRLVGLGTRTMVLQ